MITLMYITHDPGLARFALDCGVDRIFVDLETRGKGDRQGHRDTHRSTATFECVARVRAAIGRGKMLVRINPVHEGTRDEVEYVIDAGAQLIMLPMFTTQNEVETVCRLADGRAAVVPLAETREASEIVADVAALPEVTEIYVGLNDLSLSLGLSFVFKPLLHNCYHVMMARLRESGIPFGVGGIARIGTGRIPADLVLAEFIRVGATRLILSRAFHGGAASVDELNATMDLSAEIEHIRRTAARLRERSAAQVEADHQRLCGIIETI